MHLSHHWNLHSRVHPLNCFPDGCFVKRDDELSCGISGSKWRKYSSIVPALIAQNIEHLIIIAGAQSNNLLAALQVARELQLKVTAFLIQPRQVHQRGNYALSRLFLDENEIVWVAREHWSQVEELACDYLQNQSGKCFLLREGAAQKEALEGAMSLADDILLNEKITNRRFRHIFIDAGTGFAALALAKRLETSGHPARVHTLILAEDEQALYKRARQWLDAVPNNISCFYPDTARAFGAVNQTIKQEIKRVAKEEGILLDPIYTSKLFYQVRKRLSSEQFEGYKLMIHSGGVLSLSGFDLS